MLGIKTLLIALLSLSYAAGTHADEFEFTESESSPPPLAQLGDQCGDGAPECIPELTCDGGTGTCIKVAQLGQACGGGVRWPAICDEGLRCHYAIRRPGSQGVCVGA
ncbi:hypothetical protein HK102_003729 [Quaeritorhiza haematococci]|nr:hypothetical protein HK102_003729 [Quaeritorhiza haematococci]